MYFNSTEFAKLDEEEISKFLKKKIEEDHYLDYKSDIQKGEKANFELLKDLSAFANAHGGTLIIGVKEPKDNIHLDLQVVGIEEADYWAQAIENAASSMLEPRIIGLKFRKLHLSSGKDLLLIHIPQSTDRPHMLKRAKERYFYMRHHESSMPMTIHEIRSTVMEYYNTEERIKKLLEEKEYQFKRRNEFINEPKFLFQLVPLINLESKLDVFNKEIGKIFQDNIYSGPFNLFSGIQLKPTLNGVLAQDNRNQPNWQIEIYKNGYFSFWYNNMKIINDYLLHSEYQKLFELFFTKVIKVFEICKYDVPYVVRCIYFGANMTKLAVNQRIPYSDYYQENEIRFSDMIRNTGENFDKIAAELCLELFNAYGYKQITE